MELYEGFGSQRTIVFVPSSISAVRKLVSSHEGLEINGRDLIKAERICLPNE
jgi:hypothetical protein